MTTFKRWIILSVFSALLLNGCIDQKEMLRRLVPEKQDALARQFIDVVQRGDLTKANRMLSPEARGDAAEKGIQSLHSVLASGTPTAIQVIGYNFRVNYTGAGKVAVSDLSYQIQFPDSWAAGDVFLQETGNTLGVVSARFQLLHDSLERTNAFTLAGKSAVHYFFLACCTLIPLFIISTLVLCARSKIRRKWLWMLFILVGIIQFRLNWSTGQFDVQPLMFLLMGSMFFKTGPYAPVVLGFGLPIGAIVFRLRQRSGRLAGPVPPTLADRPGVIPMKPIPPHTTPSPPGNGDLPGQQTEHGGTVSGESGPEL